MNSKTPLVSVITVNYNGRKYLKKCLDSLYKLNYPKNKLELIMVDNCSTDGSVGFVKKKYPGVKIINNDVNNYCKANNLAIRRAKGKYIALINNDVKVDKDWLSELIKVIIQDEKIGVAVSKILDRDGKIQNAGLYALPNFYWDERGAGKAAKECNSITEVDAVCGACVLYRRVALDQVGLLDEDFVMFGEDVDMSIRLKRKGWSLIYAPQSVAYHKMHGSCDERFAREAIEKNRLLLIAKHYPRKLSNALIGNDYFTVVEGRGQGSGRFFGLLPDILLKLAKEHPSGLAREVIKETFMELEKIVNYENKRLEEETKNLFQDLIETRKNRDSYKDEEERYKREIKEKREEVDNLSYRLQESLDTRSEMERQLQDYKEEVDNLSRRLQESLDTRLDLERELSGVYGSTGFRFILNPLWKVIWRIRLILKIR